MSFIFRLLVSQKKQFEDVPFCEIQFLSQFDILKAKLFLKF